MLQQTTWNSRLRTDDLEMATRSLLCRLRCLCNEARRGPQSPYFACKSYIPNTRARDWQPGKELVVPIQVLM